MKYDSRFGSNSGPDGHRHRLSGKLFTTLQACHDDFLGEVTRREELAGRPLSREELINGIGRPDPRSDRERRDAEKRRAAELSPNQPDLRTEAERYRDDLLARKEAARFEALSPLDRRIEAAERRVAGEQAANTLSAAREAAGGTDAARRVSKELAAAIQHAMYSPDVSQADLDELRHQAALLDRFGDVAAVGKNVVTIQTAMLNGVTAQAEQLRASADKLAARAAKLRAEPEPPKPAADIKTLLQP